MAPVYIQVGNMFPSNVAAGNIGGTGYLVLKEIKMSGARKTPKNNTTLSNNKKNLQTQTKNEQTKKPQTTQKT